MKSKGILSFSLMLLLASAGCNLTEGDDDSQIRLSIQGNTDLLRRSLSVTIISSGWIQGVTGRDFGTPDAATYTRIFETPHSGNLRVDFRMQDSLGGHQNSGSISLDIRPDWIWDVDFVIGSRNPYYFCFGCLGSRSFALDSVYQSTPSDSLFLVWGGNSIKHPVIY